jgi:hypothetical protein
VRQCSGMSPERVGSPQGSRITRRVSSGSIGAASCSASRSACASQFEGAGEASASDADTSCEAGYRHRRLEATSYWANPRSDSASNFLACASVRECPSSVGLPAAPVSFVISPRFSCSRRPLVSGPTNRRASGNSRKRMAARPAPRPSP